MDADWETMANMTNNIVLVVESQVTPGKLEGLRTLAGEVAAHCRATEVGMLRYDWFVSDDGSSIRVLEEYVDSDAIRFHTQNCAPFQPAMAECRTVQSLQIFGEPDAELRAVLTSRGALVLAPFALS